MKNRIQLLDIAIDIDSTKVAAETTIQCLEEESSKVIYFVNSETLLLLQENKEWKEVVEATDLTLPGNAGVNNSVDEELGHKRDPFFFDGYFEQILDYAISVGAEILLVTESEEHNQQYPLVQRFCWLQRVKSIFCLCRRVFMPKDRI